MHLTRPTAEEIDLLVTRFYAMARKDPELGPVFHAAIGEDAEAWAKHQAKIAGFWRNSLGLEKGAYRGSPMEAHARAGGIEMRHFPIWLGLFERCARASMRPDAAETIVALAKRIGDGQAMGLAELRRRGGPPVLR